MRNDDCFTSPLAKLKDRCLTFSLFIFQRPHFCQSKIYTGLLTAPRKVNKLVATAAPHQLCPPAKPTHRQPGRLFVLRRWGMNGALMEFEENIITCDYPGHRVAAPPTQHQVLQLWCALERLTLLWATTLFMQREETHCMRRGEV